MSNRLRIFDWPLIIAPLLLLIFGIVVIYTVTFPTVQFSLARAQIIYALLGFALAVAATLIDYRNWQGLSILLYFFGLVLLGLVLLIGARQFGASRWINLGFFQLQPSEVFKLILIIIEARLLSLWSNKLTLWRLMLVLLVALIPIELVFRQPDLGTASVLLVITIGLLFYARLPWRWWLTMLIVASLLAPIGYLQLHDYQKSRIKVFLNPQNDPTGQAYNVRQAQIAIGSGGLIGQGLGRGTQSQLNFLPVAHTDFIFAGLAEATGLLGCSIVLVLYLVFMSRIVRTAELAKDEFGSYLALGIAVMFGSQIIVNIGMNLGVLPVTGIPLPFISSGGTSLIVSLISVGLLESIYARHKKITF